MQYLWLILEILNDLLCAYGLIMGAIVSFRLAIKLFRNAGARFSGRPADENQRINRRDIFAAAHVFQILVCLIGFFIRGFVVIYILKEILRFYFRWKGTPPTLLAACDKIAAAFNGPPARPPYAPAGNNLFVRAEKAVRQTIKDAVPLLWLNNQSVCEVGLAEPIGLTLLPGVYLVTMAFQYEGSPCGAAYLQLYVYANEKYMLTYIPPFDISAPGVIQLYKI
ncbi:MAG: hypothetical protein FWF49_05405 [Oscillospiraceae bacterium]|nr:hypothetical protein [Oscillospiraceae bacterium]